MIDDPLTPKDDDDDEVKDTSTTQKDVDDEEDEFFEPGLSAALLTPKEITNIKSGTKEFVTSPEGKITGGFIVFIVLITFMMMKACEPPKGSILYGICGAYLEQQIPFPETIKHKGLEQYQRGVRIYYTTIGTFGESKLETIECIFMSHPQRGLLMEKIIFNHVRDITKIKPIPGKGKLYEVEQEHIDHFNNSGSIPAIIAGQPDLTFPLPKEDILQNIYAREEE